MGAAAGDKKPAEVFAGSWRAMATASEECIGAGGTGYQLGAPKLQREMIQWVGTCLSHQAVCGYRWTLLPHWGEFLQLAGVRGTNSGSAGACKRIGFFVARVRKINGDLSGG